MGKFVYSFNEGSKDMRDLLGGKGANLAEMTKIGLPVPFGFTISTDACKDYLNKGGMLDDEIVREVYEHLDELEQVMGKKFGDIENPLLVSVRSGAPVSMPGMMDTILNLGLNDDSVKGLAAKTGNERFAYDSYRRFIQMFGDVVMEIPKSKFDQIFDGRKKEVGAEYDVDLKTEDLKVIIEGYKELVKAELGREFPQNPKDQLMEAIQAVFRSWNNERAILYRKLNNISASLGTAVNVQSMVFGNTGENSGTGVAFTRSPVNGENKIFGEFLVNAQGEDVVAGIRTPQPIDQMKESFPDVYGKFEDIARILEDHYKDMQDMEFTVEEGKLFMLQTRNGKRTAEAAVKVAVDMVNEEKIDKETAIMRIAPEQIDQLLHPAFDAEELKKHTPIGKGLPASPGAACGEIVFSADDAAVAKEAGKKVVLVREETSPEDLAGMVAAEGILTARGGMTSHAAVVARGMGKCCVAGCHDITVYEEEKYMEIHGVKYHEGDMISINGTDGSVYAAEIATKAPELSGNFGTIMKWADEIRTIGVRTNADNPRDAKQAVQFGAEGIGLCRTEHMFFEEERIPKIRRMILADTEEERREALAGLLPYQKGDFKGLYETMAGKPVTIRLLDPPLHEFLPKNEEDMKELSEQFGIPLEKIKTKTIELHEFNPMLGHRGCRLAVTYPEIAEMQTEAIITAALEVKKETGIDIKPEIMVPLVGIPNELKNVKKTIDETAERCFEQAGERLNYMVGTMIEIPRAALVADEIAEDAEFFSFGTNDMTQMGFGFSRDDTGKIIREYVEKGVLEEDPFQVLDQRGVGKLVKMAAEEGRKTRPNIKLGICGEHGGNPKTIDFCHRLGLNYVSCSPFRVPIARLAAAQAAIRNK
ncbi:MAG: pyruvate, phosphate dikinase [Clostridia bacterium]|uniref:Pyruvate, phosphate dikinase n=1 Tax=Mogibacterium kristiansenii TaxID=2606708 RepID=A0A6N7XIY6_9FIRM|nr:MULTISPECIES: pyruvate, phosphate dikinase [Mogibacterium]MDY5450486.1 pyruvate, phosphate dikinase [Clostridia bacterium]MBN2935129.1 pyruvate, phosphate dikinase [Mogibacterium sp.]MCI7123387.1 pyruvate, phosphate dikinase [Mogibacterium sp.]MDD6699751.1 pyruvate, phosphate dikinase [Mogibacterium kristiansenii]MEE0369496.1 pyruvate, phosphate dikinase [Clostridia bacterium]